MPLIRMDLPQRGGDRVQSAGGNVICGIFGTLNSTAARFDFHRFSHFQRRFFARCQNVMKIPLKTLALFRDIRQYSRRQVIVIVAFFGTKRFSDYGTSGATMWQTIG